MNQKCKTLNLRPSRHGGGTMLIRLLIALVILNTADMALIIWGIHLGMMEELNPLMQWCIDQGTLFFFLVKSSLCAGYVFVSLWSKRPRYIGKITSVVVTIYLVVVARTIGLFLIYYEP